MALSGHCIMGALKKKKKLKVILLMPGFYDKEKEQGPSHFFYQSAKYQ